MSAPPDEFASPEGSERYLRRFVALFDARRYWDAHEALEELWQRDRQDLYQGLIQLAAAFVHVDRANWRGAATLLERTLGKLAPYRGRCEGVDVDAVRERARGILEHVRTLERGQARAFDESHRVWMASLVDR